MLEAGPREKAAPQESRLTKALLLEEAAATEAESRAVIWAYFMMNDGIGTVLIANECMFKKCISTGPASAGVKERIRVLNAEDDTMLKT